ncbi:hypothetical protein M426DRAFT_19214 [Hypoxylon sp. CI-4A]|nr:hypothetical protein M426DRAFT_19214 [Hypoxylon sp. CI-4A]
MDTRVQPVQSAELPVMPDTMAKLVKMIDAGDPYNLIYETITKSDLVDAIENKSFLDRNLLWELFHSMSRPLLRSVLMKTLGPDLYDRDFTSKQNWEHIYGPDGPGAYVVFLCIRERDGKFLNVKELKELIEQIGIYADAVDISEKNGRDGVYRSNSEFADEEEATLRRAMEIDNVDRSKVKHLRLYKPRFASSSNHNKSANIRDLVTMLEKRILPNVDEDVWQMQSPLLVGNAGNIASRAIDHIPKSSNSTLPSSAHVWRLLISCLRVMGIKFDTQYAPLFRAWAGADQVNGAEVLGTILAGSLISVDGCNVKQPGTRTGSDGAKTPTNAYDDEMVSKVKQKKADVEAFKARLKEAIKETKANLLNIEERWRPRLTNDGPEEGDDGEEDDD